MSPLRARMIEDMTLAGLAMGTQNCYVQAVRQLAKHYHRSPDLLREEDVRNYLLGLRQRGVACGAG
jgi:integrase/recombinase XerD